MDNKELIKVEIAGIPVSSSVSGGGFALLLKEVEGERRLPIIIGHFEAQAIAFEIEGLKPPRPLTHELLKTILESLNYGIDSVVINELRDSTFFAKIKLDSDEIDDIDARPSDAIAMALKFKAPIFVSKDVMDEIGFIPKLNDEDDITDFDGMDFDEVDEKDTENAEVEDILDNLGKDAQLKKLHNDLEEAVNNEEFEKAAELRDKIKNLEISNLN
ncbi:MAG: bifunctional nuclease domain-containing protein [Ignavibacteriota bacterium]